MELTGSDDACVKAGQLLRAFREQSGHIIHIQHISARPGAGFFLPNTPGSEIHAGVAPRPGESVFVKHFPNSFRETPLLQHLRDREMTDLIICGMMTQMCIDTTTRAAADLGFRCILAHDACATRTLSFGGATVAAQDVQTAFLAALDGLFAKVLPVERICEDL